MNFLRRGLSLLKSTATSLVLPNTFVSPPVHAASAITPLMNGILGRLDFLTRSSSIYQMLRRGPHFKTRRKRQPLDGHPFKKGVVLKTLIKKPKKPNSANRKCVLVRLSNGKEMVAYVPGIGHNLQEHNIVLVRCGRLRDTPGVKIKCVRGAYDLPHVVKQTK